MRFAILAAAAAVGMSAPVGAAVTVVNISDAPIVRFVDDPRCSGPSACIYTANFSFDTATTFGAGAKSFAVLTLELDHAALNSFKLNGVEVVDAPRTFYQFGSIQVLRYMPGFAIPQINTVEFTLTLAPTGDRSFYAGHLLLGDSPVPEPATWAMLIAGFGMIGQQFRRRRKMPAHALGNRYPPTKHSRSCASSG